MTEPSRPPGNGGPTPALELEHITAGYERTVILRDVSLSVPHSGVVALLGPNGAGKTTVLRTASGLLRPMSGRIRLDGVDMTGRGCHQMARAGLCHLPEGRGIFPSLSVRDNLVLESPKGSEAASIEKAVGAFPVLGNRLRQQAGSLSGGEQQMLALVRAFVTEPKVVVVDEASLGLAPILVNRIFETLRHIAESGVALLIVEQYIHRALELADTVYLINRGRIVFHGTTAELEGDELFESYLGMEGAAERG